MSKFNVIVYLKGRKEYLRVQSMIYESGSAKERTSQARLSEVAELLTILEHEENSNET